MNPTSDPWSAVPASEITIDAPCEDILPDPDNPRKTEGADEDLPALAASLKTLGQQMAITVYENPQRADGRRTYTVISGHRRLMAAKFAGLKTLKAMVVRKPQTRGQRHLARLAENKARKGLSPIEDVDAVAKARHENPELPNKAIADLTGYSESDVSKCLTIAGCSVAHAALADGRLKGIGEAYAVAKAAPEQREGLIAFRQAGGSAKAMPEAGKPKRVAPTVKLDRIPLRLPGGCAVTVTGADLDGEALVDALTLARDAAIKANKESIDVKTLVRVLADKAKAVGP